MLQGRSGLRASVLAFSMVGVTLAVGTVLRSAPPAGPIAGDALNPSKRPTERSGQARLGGDGRPVVVADAFGNVAGGGSDACASNQPVGVGTHAFTTSGATTDGPNPVPFDTPPASLTNDVWYRFTATCDGTLTVSLCPTGTAFDSALAVYHDPQNPTQCACPIDNANLWPCGVGADETCHPEVSGGSGFLAGRATSGGCYLIRIGGYSGGGGNGDVEISLVCGTPAIPAPPPPNPNPLGATNRYLSFSISDPGIQAVRITIVDLPAPFESHEGEVLWVGAPADVSESSSSTGSTPAPTFKAATPGCFLIYRNWVPDGFVYVSGAAIVPGATYALQSIYQGISPGYEGAYSSPLLVRTSASGDITGGCRVTPCLEPDGRVNFDDLAAGLLKFANVPGAPIKARSDLDPNVPDRRVNFSDIVRVLDAYRGVAYSFAGPTGACGLSCSTCGNSIIEVGEACDDGDATPGDGCDSHCQEELCGNSAIDLGEECDDGDAMSGDGCDSLCQLEPVCPNGIIERGEECDDNDSDPGDGCSPACRTEGTATIHLLPISASGTHSIIANEIRLTGGGQRVFLAVFIDNWDADLDGTPRLKTFQAGIDATGFSSGSGAALSPAVQACSTDADCIAAFGDNSRCGFPPGVTGLCEPGFQFTAQLGYILSTGTNLSTVDLSSSAYRFGGTIITGSTAADPGVPRYAGTLVLTYPPSANGTYEIGFSLDETFLRDAGDDPIGIASFTPARIVRDCTTPADCDDGVACTLDSCITGSCVFTPNDALCDDLLFCTGVETCNAAAGCLSDGNPCVIGECDEPTDTCGGDCNFNGVADADDIILATSSDCNLDETPDECEIDENSTAPGGPFYCVVMCDPDCNDNGIPDDCDIAACDPGHPNYPACDDCNLNGGLDGCDIAGGSSLDDAPEDGVPDECVSAGPGMNWSDDIWDLPGPDPYPDNVDGVASLHVTLDDVSIFFDVDGEIQTLRILDGAALRVTQTGTEGDLSVVDPGGVLVQGALLVANDRVIEVPSGPLVIGSGGYYGEGDPGDTIVTSAKLTTSEAAVQGGLCDPFTPPGAMELTEQMTVAVTGDFVLDGRAGDPACAPGGVAGNGSVAGGRTPPIMSIRKFAIGSNNAIEVAGAFRLLDSAEVCVQCGGAPGDDPTVSVGGDFDNQSQYATLFNWERGGLVLNGPGLQTFEVAGLDVGPIDEGFSTDRDTLTETASHTNFSLPSLEIAPDSEVNFVNRQANTAALAACAEALYVDVLTIGSGSLVRFDNARVYFRTLIGGDGTTVFIGCGRRVKTCRPTRAVAATGITTAGESAVEPRQRYLAFQAGDPGRRQAVRIIFDSLPSPWDLWNDTVLWVEAPRDLSELAGQSGTQPPTFKAAELTCAGPVYRQWDPGEVLHVHHPGIVPGGVYRVQVVDESCSAGDENNFSAPLVITNARWGNVAGPFRTASGMWTVPDNSVDVTVDVIAVLEKFANRPGAPGKSRADVEPCVQDHRLNISDVTQVLNAFRGIVFPFWPGMPPGPGSCVSMDPCAY